MECLKCKNSTIKNNNNCFDIFQYTETQIIFNMPNNSFGKCMDFGKAIYYGKYECIDKSNNTYYILNNIETNTGVIKDCYKSCNTCWGEGDDQNMNCIECAYGYAKT